MFVSNVLVIFNCPNNILHVCILTVIVNGKIIKIIDWGEVFNMCGARCLIGRDEASKGAKCPRGRVVNWGEMSGSPE